MGGLRVTNHNLELTSVTQNCLIKDTQQLFLLDFEVVVTDIVDRSGRGLSVQRQFVTSGRENIRRQIDADTTTNAGGSR